MCSLIGIPFLKYIHTVTTEFTYFINDTKIKTRKIDLRRSDETCDFCCSGRDRNSIGIINILKDTIGSGTSIENITKFYGECSGASDMYSHGTFTVIIDANHLEEFIMKLQSVTGKAQEVAQDMIMMAEQNMDFYL
jgi:hypothetical protein